MARKVQPVTITAEGRDKGKVFVLTEMPADQVEEWGMRAVLALAAAGTDLPEGLDAMDGVAAAIAMFKGLGQLDWQLAKPLLDEMFQCVTIKKALGGADDMREPRELMDGDIEEVTTRLKLRMDIFTLHTGFTFPVAKPKG